MAPSSDMIWNYTLTFKTAIVELEVYYYIIDKIIFLIKESSIPWLVHHTNQINDVLWYCCYDVVIDKNKGFTYVKEGASMLQYELTGVWFILTVIYIDVEFISLGGKKGER